MSSHRTIDIKDLITLNCFARELGAHFSIVYYHMHQGALTGSVRVAGMLLIDRASVDMPNCAAFHEWVRLGGRLGPVQVPKGWKPGKDQSNMSA